ncbi:MAG: carbohydrate ABC transporter permease [Chloroflexi bacterium]|nr:carbohydrate ABC transporter permease [Chloroflexota bacterium]MDA8186817.1 carbohydrate ABC transporter permease [Dehalococcoidales bacterium]
MALSVATGNTKANNRRSSQMGSGMSRLFVHAVLIGVGFFYMYPFLWVLASSFKTPSEFFNSGPSLIPHQLLWDNYVYAWNTGQFGTYFLNTIIVTVSVTLLVILFTSMAGYVLSKTHFPGKKLIIGGMLALMFLPGGYTIIPVFDLVNRLGLLNTLWSIILVQTAGGLVFNTLLFMGYFATIGKEVEEAARVDGADLPRTYWYVMLPMAKPMIATVGLFQFMNNWNSFWIPLVFTIGNPSLRTLAVGLYSFVGENSTGWTYIAAGAVMSILPIIVVFFFLQRYFIEAVAGAIKG